VQAGLPVEQIRDRFEVEAFGAIRWKSTPGSSAPQRSPIGRPSSAVNAMLVALLGPPEPWM
jgi:hypothetical protein